MATEFKDVDKGYQALFRRLGKGAGVTVGIHKDRGSDDHEGATVAEIATWAEFGLGQPQRSWLRDWVTEQEGDINKAISALGIEVIKGPLSAPQAIEQLGVLLKAKIQERMANGIPPENAESTIRQKGSSTPLIDTGQLRSSIDYKVTKGSRQ